MAEMESASRIEKASFQLKGPGYYKEFTVDPVSAGSGGGAERLVAGQGGEVYYTPNHYGSFVRVR